MLNDDLRPRRSVLYMPGANERALEKAKTIPADALILDLEDAVAPDAKAEARARVCAAAGSGDYGRKEITIRANGLDTPWHADDLRAIAEAGPAARRGAQDQLGRRRGRGREGARGRRRPEPHPHLGHARDADRHPARRGDRHLQRAAGRAGDGHQRPGQGAARRARARSRSRCVFGLSQCLLAARMAGKVILDGVYNDIKDADGFLAECVQGRQLGFDGKTLIHPSQVEPCNDTFAPSEEELTRSRGLILAFEEAQAEGKGVATYEGRMIENMHVDNARRAIAMAEAIAELQS